MIMKITETLLLEKGFEKKCINGGCYYVKGKVGVVYNDIWLPCNIETGEPYNTGIYVETLEDLYKLANKAGIEM